jgi:menaquinone-dependent protoporphyrinogen IX oxidase
MDSSFFLGTPVYSEKFHKLASSFTVKISTRISDTPCI